MEQIIRKNNITAIEIRTGLFVLAQSIGHGTFVFFNHFVKNINELEQINSDNLKILCCITMTKNCRANCKKIKTRINPRLDLLDYKKINHLSLVPFNENYGFERRIIYKGTDDEMEISFYNGDLRLVNWKLETIEILDKNKDTKIIEEHQLDLMGEYGELLERLYLSYKYGKFIEPMKDLIIGKILPYEYKIYFQIISGKITGEEYKELTV